MSSKIWKAVWPRLVLLLFLLVGVFGVIGFFSKRPTNLGVRNGLLAPCPDSPNCVCSQYNDDQHNIDPIPYKGSTAEAMARLKKAIATLPRQQIITENPTYLHIEFTTLLMRYIDDVEFYINENRHLIHFRSASRVGHSDFGLNRSRMEAIRKAFENGG